MKIPLPPLKIQKQIVIKLSAVQDYPSSIRLRRNYGVGPHTKDFGVGAGKKQLLAQRAKLKELFGSVSHCSMSSR